MSCKEVKKKNKKLASSLGDASTAEQSSVGGLPFAIVQISILNTSYFGQMIWQMESECSTVAWLALFHS